VIDLVTEADLPELLPLMRGYCDFYEVNPSDDALLAMSRELIADPAKEGLQLIARDQDGRAVGFATIFWTWSTLTAERLGVMNDLFVDTSARGTGAADALIAACAERCRERGVLLNPFGPRAVRAVTHLDVTDDQCRAAARVMRAVADGA